MSSPTTRFSSRPLPTLFRIRHLGIVLTVVAAVLATPTPALAAVGPWSPSQELGALAPADGDSFGSNLALDGERMVVGAHLTDLGGNNRGAVHVFDRYAPTGLWLHTQQLTDPTPTDDNIFGSWVALDGNRIAVGAPGTNGAGSDRGAIHVFDRNPATGVWTHIQELTDPAAADTDLLGMPIALDGDRIAGSALGDDGAGTDRGAVHVFDRNPATGVWTHIQELTDPAPADSDFFGFGMALDGDRIATSSIGDDGAGTDRGAIHVFDRNPATGVWTHMQQLGDPFAQDTDLLGWSVDLDGSRIAATSVTDDGAGTDRGAAHVFDRNPTTGIWSHTQELNDPNAADSDSFGWSVQVEGNRLAVGAVFDDGAGTDRGAVHVFDRNPTTSIWSHTQELSDPFTADDDHLGDSVAIDGDHLVAGAPRDDGTGTDRGAVHVFDHYSCRGQAATIVGTLGNDTLTGTANKDVIASGYGDDTVSGGGGDDVICLGPGNDTGNGQGGDDTIFGDDGTDTIDGGDGDDLIRGGKGNDEVFGGPGADNIRGQGDDDTLAGGTGADRVNGGGGADTLKGQGGDDMLLGGVGDDILKGGAGQDTLRGHIGDDLLRGNGDSDTLFGGGGIDRLYGGGGPDVVKGQSGDDDVRGGNGADLLKGNSGVDILRGGGDDDTLVGGGGNDTLLGQAGFDRADGGIGTDTCTAEIEVLCEA